MKAGSKLLKGCPDADGDEIADKNDNCPKEKGLMELGGCNVQNLTIENKNLSPEQNKILFNFTKNIIYKTFTLEQVSTLKLLPNQTLILAVKGKKSDVVRKMVERNISDKLSGVKYEILEENKSDKTGIEICLKNE